jgi:predicted AlkP superfamily phosphohydrolase/phosphomutase
MASGRLVRGFDMTERLSAGRGFARAVYSGIQGGAAAGIVLAVWSWFYQGSIPDGGLDFAQLLGFGGFVTTLSLMCLTHAILGLVLGCVVGIVAAIVRRPAPFFLAASLTFGLAVASFAAMNILVLSNLDLPASVSLGDPLRTEITRRALIIFLGIAVAAIAVSGVLFSRLKSAGARRVLPIVLAVAIIISGVSVASWNITGAKYGTLESVGQSTGGTGKVVLIGLDGATWQLLDHFSEEGLLPNIDRMRAAGATTNLVTHGRRLSPAVWTGMATGWSHAKHGISNWMLPDPSTGQSRTIRSSDRRKPAIWQILPEFGRTTVAINWLASYPAERTQGVIVSRIVDLDEHTVYPPELLPEVAAVVDSIDTASGDEDWSVAQVNTVFGLARHFLEKGQPDLTLLYVRSTDRAHHRYWAAYEPQYFGEEWGVTDEYVREGNDLLRRLWSNVDQKIGELENATEAGTSILIVSDHGFKPRTTVMGYLRRNDLMEGLGYVTWMDGEPGTVDYSRTRAFSGGLDTYDPMVGIYVNSTDLREDGVVPADSTVVVARRIARQLSELRVQETGEPLFLSVGVTADGAPERVKSLGFDVYAEQSSVLRQGGKGRTIMMPSGPTELDNFMESRESNSGNHAPRAVFIGVGPGFKRQVCLPLVADSPYTTGLTYLTGYVPSLNPYYALARRIGWIDPYTTIDIAPTLLYLLGLPLSEEMDGRLMERVIEPAILKGRRAAVIPGYGHLRASDVEDVGGTMSEETLEELRSLGYIQ